MSYEVPVLDLSFPAGADLSGKQYQLVKLNASKQVILCASAGEQALGVLQNKPTSTQDATVRLYGVSKVLTGGTVTVGDLVATDGNGKLKTCSALVQATGVASSVCGIALETSTGANQIVAVLFTPTAGVKPTGYA